MSLVPSVDGSAADRPVQLREEDLEMSIFLPPVIRKSFEEVSAQLQTLFKLCRDMEANVGLKSDKAHMLLELKGKADAETSEQQFAEVWNQLHRQQSMMERLGSLESQFAGMGNLRQEFEEHRQEAVGRLQQCEQHGGMLKRVMEQMRDSTNDRLKDIEKRLDLADQRQTDLREITTNLTQRLVILENFRSRQEQQNEELLSKASETLDRLRVQESEMLDLKRVVEGSSKRLDTLFSSLEREILERQESCKSISGELASVGSQVQESILSARQANDAASRLRIDLSRLDDDTKGMSRELSGAARDSKLDAMVNKLQEQMTHFQREIADLYERQMTMPTGEGIKEESPPEPVLRFDASVQVSAPEPEPLQLPDFPDFDAWAARLDGMESSTHTMQAQCSELLDKLSRCEGNVASLGKEVATKANDDEFRAVRELATALEAGLQRETRQREIDSHASGKRMQATKDSLLELLDEKANWWDVQRALWMKVDRDELPVALSTKGLQSQGLDSAGALQRTHRPPGPAPSVDGPPPRCLSCDTFHGLNHPFVPEHSQRRIQAGEKEVVSPPRQLHRGTSRSSAGVKEGTRASDSPPHHLPSGRPESTPPSGAPLDLSLRSTSVSTGLGGAPQRVSLRDMNIPRSPGPASARGQRPTAMAVQQRQRPHSALLRSTSSTAATSPPVSPAQRAWGGTGGWRK